MGCLALIIQIIGGIIFFRGVFNKYYGGSLQMVIGVVIFFLSIIPLVKLSKKQDKIENERKKKVNMWKKVNGIPNNCKVIKCLTGLIPGDYYIWRQINFLTGAEYLDDNIKTGREIPKKFRLNVDSINFFNIVGDAYTETNVTGGGSSIAGAVVGGVVAGATGSIIGSRKKIETENTRIDNRKTIITYKENGIVKSIFFSPEAYEVLLELIPEKDINFVNINK